MPMQFAAYTANSLMIWMLCAVGVSCVIVTACISTAAPQTVDAIRYQSMQAQIDVLVSRVDALETGMALLTATPHDELPADTE
jgi:hypothetical protein